MNRIHDAPSLPPSILAIADHVTVSDAYPQVEATVEPQPAYSGLTVVDNVFGCSLCPNTGSEKAVRAHIKKAHPGLNTDIIPRLQCQTLNPGGTKINFRVHARLPPAISPPTDSLLDQFHAFDWRQVTSGALPNSRLISPFLLRSHWHKLVQPYTEQISQLCDLVAMPKDDEFPELQGHIHTYFDRATRLLDHTEDLVLQRVNSPDPDKE